MCGDLLDMPEPAARERPAFLQVGLHAGRLPERGGRVRLTGFTAGCTSAAPEGALAQ